MIRFHQDVGIFRQAVSITQLRTGFAERLIEKDYFSSVLLEYLAAVEEALVFKGGTCLAKVYADFYRPHIPVHIVPTRSRSCFPRDASSPQNFPYHQAGTGETPVPRCRRGMAVPAMRARFDHFANLVRSKWT